MKWSLSAHARPGVDKTANSEMYHSSTLWHSVSTVLQFVISIDSSFPTQRASHVVNHTGGNQQSHVLILRGTGSGFIGLSHERYHESSSHLWADEVVQEYT